MLRSLSDAELINLFCEQNNMQAIAVLMERHNALIIGMAIRYLKDQEEAKDFSQELFFKLVKEICKKEITTFKSWLGRLVRNYLIDFLRKFKNLPQTFDFSEEFLPGNLADLTVLPDDPERQEQNNRCKSRLEAVMHQLREQERLVIQRKYFENKGYREIMKEKGWTYNQTRGYRDRAVSKLGNLLGESFQDCTDYFY